MIQQLPYCGSAPVPGELLSRFNGDPKLIIIFVFAVWFHLVAIRRSGAKPAFALAGWAIAAVAFMSPLCALSVSLFSARVGQHMILVLAAAPLIALGSTPTRPRTAASLWTSGLVFFAALWFWHMPAPYARTFVSVPVYWTMHLTLFGSAVWLWASLLQHAAHRTWAVLMVGLVTSIQMGLLGAVLALATRPLFEWHLATTAPWGLSPLQDQQLGGIFMWVPGITLFLWAALRSLSHLWRSLEKVRPA